MLLGFQGRASLAAVWAFFVLPAHLPLLLHCPCFSMRTQIVPTEMPSSARSPAPENVEGLSLNPGSANNR